MNKEYNPTDRMLLYFRSVTGIIVTLSIAMVLMSVIMIMQPIGRILKAKSEIAFAQAKGMQLIPELEFRALELERQIKTLTSQSIENRLSRIEKAIEIGDVKPEDLTSLQELRNEFKKLKEYMFVDPQRVIEFRTIQTQYTDLKSNLDNKMDIEDVKQKIGSLKDLFYVTLALMGILISILAGAWFIAVRRQIKTEVTQDNSST